MFEFINFLEFFTFVAGVSIAIYVFVRNPKGQINIALAIAALGMAGWNLSVFSIMNELASPMLGSRLAFTFAVLPGIGFTWFVYQYPIRIKHYRGLTMATLTLGALFVLITILPAFILNAEMPGGYVVVDMHPILYPMWTLFFVGNFFYTFVLLIVRAMKSHGVNRSRLFQIMWGFLLFFIPSQMSNLLLPFLFDDYRWNNLGPVFTIFLIAFMVNAVLQYRLLDIRWIVSRSLVFSALGGIIFWILISATLLISNLVGTSVSLVAGALIIVIFYRPIFAGIEYVFGKLAHKGTYNPDEATEQIFQIVRSYGTLEVLVDQLSEHFEKYFSTEQFGLVVFKSGTNRVMHSYLNGFPKSVQRHLASLEKFAKASDNQIVEMGELEWRIKYGTASETMTQDRDFLQTLKEAGIETLIPLTVDENVVGLMFFGSRRYDRILRGRDIRFLNLIRSGVSPALENAAKFAEITQLYAELSELDRAKSDFITVVSHRFRTPLSAIRWNLETALDNKKSIDGDMRTIITDAYDRTLFLVKTLDQLFDTLALESGKLKMKKESMGAKAAMKQLVAGYKQACRENKIKFTTKIAPIKIHGDIKWLMEACNVLLSNAVMYTPAKGEITFTITRHEGKIKISVKDTGIGIRESDHEKIFNKFYRTKGGRKKYQDGQGIGLYLVKRIISLHGGEVEVKSKFGKGSTFSLILPDHNQPAKKK